MTSKELLSRQLNHQAARLRHKAEQLEGRSTRMSYFRLGYFLLAVIGLYFMAGTQSDALFFGSLALLLTGFLYLITVHRKITHYRDQLNALADIKEMHVGRLELQWERLSPHWYSVQAPDHPFADDLNITGRFSLHHLLDSAVYEGGSKRLADWLLQEDPELQPIIERQKLVQELTPLSLFRDRIQVNARMNRMEESDKDWTLEKLLMWMRTPRNTSFKGTLAILSLLSITNVILLFTATAGLTGPYVLFTFLAYVGFYNFNSHKIADLYDASYQIKKQLDHFSSILVYVEQFTFKKDSGLRNFLQDFKTQGSSPSDYMRKVSRLAGAASLRKNQVLWPLVNMVLPWDMFFSMKMEELKIALEPRLSHWLDTFYELEALNSLAAFNDLNPEYTFPVLDEHAAPLLDAKALGHPLIPHHQKVTNHFKVEEGEDLFLITGSNMAGKSTFLRTVGVNLCLAFAGAPVNATQFTSRPFRLFTSINVKDSLEQGLSHFYSEVRRLRRLLDELKGGGGHPLFFFVDEIYKGTNNRERFAGSAAFLKEVAGKKGVGMVSTHDLELATLEEEIPELSNWHFAETIEHGKMNFGYKLRPGPCPTTNALKIMEIEGLPVQ